MRSLRYLKVKDTLTASKTVSCTCYNQMKFLVQSCLLSWLLFVEYMEHIVAFLNVYEDDNSSISFWKTFFNNEILLKYFLKVIQVQMTFVTEFFPKIIKLIQNLEGPNYTFTHILWSQLNDLMSSLECQNSNYFRSKTMCLIRQKRTWSEAQSYVNDSGKEEFKYSVTHVYSCFTWLFTHVKYSDSTHVLKTFKMITFWSKWLHKDIDGYNHFHIKLHTWSIKTLTLISSRFLKQQHLLQKLCNVSYSKSS